MQAFPVRIVHGERFVRSKTMYCQALSQFLDMIPAENTELLRNVADKFMSVGLCRYADTFFLYFIFDFI